MKKELEEIAINDGRYSPEIVKFVYDGLGYTVESYLEEPDHISGQMLCEGLREYALEKWGYLAKMVLNQGGIKSTRDFGEIVYLLIEHKWMSAQPTDSIDDFNEVYRFDSAFKQEITF